MNVRFATEQDGPALWSILDDYLTDLTDDSRKPTLMWLGEIITDRELITVTDEDDYPVAYFWLETDDNPEARLVHFGIRPQYWKPFIRERMLFKGIQLAFDNDPSIKQLKAEIPLNYDAKRKRFKGRTTALNIVRKLGFKQCGFYRKDFRIKGKYYDNYMFQLHRKWWNKLVKVDNVLEVAA